VGDAAAPATATTCTSRATMPNAPFDHLKRCTLQPEGRASARSASIVLIATHASFSPLSHIWHSCTWHAAWRRLLPARDTFWAPCRNASCLYTITPCYTAARRGGMPTASRRSANAIAGGLPSTAIRPSTAFCATMARVTRILRKVDYFSTSFWAGETGGRRVVAKASRFGRCAATTQHLGQIPRDAWNTRGALKQHKRYLLLCGEHRRALFPSRRTPPLHRHLPPCPLPGWPAISLPPTWLVYVAFPSLLPRNSPLASLFCSRACHLHIATSITRHCCHLRAPCYLPYSRCHCYCLSLMCATWWHDSRRRTFCNTGAGLRGILPPLATRATSFVPIVLKGTRFLAKYLT